VTLAQVQVWATDAIDAVSAAAQTYLASPVTAANKALVTTIVADLQTAKAAITAVVNVSDARSIALEVVAFIQQIEPVVAPFLGSAAPYIPVAIAVLQAFIAGLPLPPDASTSPPVELHRMALRYHP
jgi:hypothetical protein